MLDTLNNSKWEYTSFLRSRQTLHFRISLYSLSSCLSFSATEELSTCDFSCWAFLLRASRSSSTLFLSNLVGKSSLRDKKLSLHSSYGKEMRITNILHTSLFLDQSAALWDKLDSFPPGIVLLRACPSAVEKTFSHRAIFFGYFLRRQCYGLSLQRLSACAPCRILTAAEGWLVLLNNALNTKCASHITWSSSLPALNS